MTRTLLALTMGMLLAGTAYAQPVADDTPTPDPKATTTDDANAAPAPASGKARPITMQHFRPYDQRGINMFEAPKDPGVEYTGFKLDFGAAFTSQVQNISHSNAAAPVMVNGVNTNQLADIGFGFNNSTANLYLNAQLAKGVRVALSTYLSSRHHNETWVKDGYILIDGSPIENDMLDLLMQYVTLRIGHFEINYGDAHFRRTDNGNAIYNPFVGNYILDSFTTEIGAEVYLRAKNLMVMGAITGGEIRGTVLTPQKRSPAIIGKLGYDRQVKPDLRVRLTGSMYHTERAMSSTLFGGDRAGSRYYYVVENTTATETAQFTSGLINPGFRNKVTAIQVNPFVKYRGFEVFGLIERAEGRTVAETTNREFRQYAVDAVYRFLPDEKFFAGIRYNTVEGRLMGIANDVGADRWQVGGGWFILPGLLAKVEYVNQKFNGYPANNIRNGGKFHGVIAEGVVAF